VRGETTLAQSYYDAGYSRNNSLATATKEAQRLMENPWVKARIEEIKAKIYEAQVMDERERRVRLSEGGRADIADFIGEDGIPILSKEIPNHRAVREYSITERFTKAGDRIVKHNIKLEDALGNIQELNKMDHLYDTTNHINFNDIKIMVVREEQKQIDDHGD